MRQESTIRSSQASVSAAVATAKSGGHSSSPSEVRFPGEDRGHSLAEMAQRDLDSALQLLADRAQYITGANGAAIALRRKGKQDLLCRASTGSNAPELGALLSTEFGLSGESVRTRRVLRCDDAERDARVNHEVCRELGIASVVVMPVVHDDEVLGVFELFSGKANAFGARDLSALERLSEMVDTAVRLAWAAEDVPERWMTADVPTEATFIEGTALSAFADSILEVEGPAVVEAAREWQVKPAPASSPAASAEQVELPPLPHKPPRRALLWSAAPQADEAQLVPDFDRSHVPPVLRNLRKCEACGFPVSAGRALCVECEEKKWRGQLKTSQPAPRQSGQAQPSMPNLQASSQRAAVTMAAAPALPTDIHESKRVAGHTNQTATVSEPPVQTAKPRIQASQAGSPALVLSAGLESSQSWFSANKYILGVLLLVAAVVAVILLR